jgi:excisionase family DNA binding protein
MQQQMASPSQELLTARQVQELLHVDRSTVYRMAGDGRLSAVRVGKQLRFPAARLNLLLDQGRPDGDGPDPRAAQAAVAVAAELLGVTMLVADMAGRPLTGVANPAPWFRTHADDDELRACLAHWRALADDPDLAPRFLLGPQGFECARAFIRAGSSLVGMVLAGGVAPAGDGPDRRDLHQLDPAARQAVLRALPRIAAVLSPGPAAAPSQPDQPPLRPL